MRHKVLILGKGGREHVLAQHVARSPLLERLWVCPGNAGMALCGFECVADDSKAAILRFCAEHQVDTVIPGPEAYMVTDLKAALAKAGVYCFAPTPELARLESSKAFAKGVLQDARIATADAETIDDVAAGEAALQRHDFSAGGLVLKADGLAAGKGVVVCATRAAADAAFARLQAAHGFPILFEEQLEGPELSAFALCSGTSFRFLGTACDYKRITPDPYSANTGGMGAYSPCGFVTPEDGAEIRSIFAHTLQVLAQRGLHYEGFLFAGLMKTARGIQVLEFNVRLGDPETQVLLPRLRDDLLALIMQARAGMLPLGDAALRPEHAVHVVAASHGYPESEMLLGQPITLPADLDPVVFAGVTAQGDGLANSGGRVLGVTEMAATRPAARQAAYAVLKSIVFEGMVCRADIGQ